MYSGTQFPIPGYYRAQKNWDVVFVRDGKLVAVVELKSLTGEAGKNTNNRMEEVLGVAHDFWHAYREKLIGSPPPPWTGYFFLLDGNGRSRFSDRWGCLMKRLIRAAMRSCANGSCSSEIIRRRPCLCRQGRVKSLRADTGSFPLHRFANHCTVTWSPIRNVCKQSYVVDRKRRGFHQTRRGSLHAPRDQAGMRF